MTASSTASTHDRRRAARALARYGGAILLVLAAVPAMAQDYCRQPRNRDWSAWLDLQESIGGHTEACHLNVDINGLIGRIENRGGHKGPACLPGAAASAWSGRKSLLDEIKPVIIQSGSAYAQGAAGDYVIEGLAGAKIGTVVTAYAGPNPNKNRSPCPKNRKYVCSSTTKWAAIVRKNAQGECYLLTAYPTR